MSFISILNCKLPATDSICNYRQGRLHYQQEHRHGSSHDYQLHSESHPCCAKQVGFSCIPSCTQIHTIRTQYGAEGKYKRDCNTLSSDCFCRNKFIFLW